MASSSDGKEQLEKNSSTQAISENSLTSTSTDLKSDIEAAHSSNKIIIDDTQTKSSPKSTIVTTSTSGLKINLQNLPLNTTSIIKNLPNPTTLTSSVNNISNIYSLMLSQNQQQSTGSGIPGGLKHSVLSQPNLPIVTMMSGKNGNGNGNFNNCKGSNKIVITNSGGINPNGGHSSTRIITTTSPATSTCSSVDNLPKSMPSSLKSSIITSATSSNATSSSSSLNLKSMSPISFTSATDSKASLIKGSANIKQLSQSVISPQTQTVQLVNNIVNFSTSNIIPVGQSSPSQNYKQQHKISATHSSFIIPQLISPIHSQTQQNSRSSIVVNAVDNIAISNQPNAFNNLEQNQASPSVNVNSPTASPIKPNIIRKSRKDPPHSTLNFNSTNSMVISSNDQIFNNNNPNPPFHQHAAASLVNKKNSIYELSQDQIKNMAISTVIPNLSVPTNSFSGSLTNALTGINSFSNHLIEASPSINTCSQNNMEFSHKTPKQQKIVELNQFALTSGLMSTSLINSIPENNELLGKTLSNSTQSLIEKRSPRKKRKQEFKILDFNVGFSENPLAIKRPNLNEYEWNLKEKNLEQENTLVQDLDVKKTNIEKSSESKTSESLKSHSLALSTGSKLISSKSQKNTLNENSSHISLPFSPIHFSESLKDIQVGISSDDDYVKTEDDELSNNELYLDEETVKILSQEFSYIAPDGLKWVLRKPRFSLSTDLLKNKDQFRYHLKKYSDMNINKVHEHETSSKMIPLKEFEQSLSHWKFYYVTSHIDQHIAFENESADLVNEIESLVHKLDDINGFTDITFKISESIKANNQRHKSINEQLDETRLLLNRLVEHKNLFKNESINPKSKIRKFSSSSSASSTFSLSYLPNKRTQKSSISTKTSANIKK